MTSISNSINRWAEAFRNAAESSLITTRKGLAFAEKAKSLHDALSNGSYLDDDILQFSGQIPNIAKDSEDIYRAFRDLRSQLGEMKRQYSDPSQPLAHLVGRPIRGASPALPIGRVEIRDHLGKDRSLSDIDNLFDKIRAFVDWWSQDKGRLNGLILSTPQIERNNPLRLRTVMESWTKSLTNYQLYEANIRSIQDHYCRTKPTGSIGNVVPYSQDPLRDPPRFDRSPWDLMSHGDMPGVLSAPTTSSSPLHSGLMNGYDLQHPFSRESGNATAISRTLGVSGVLDQDPLARWEDDDQTLEGHKSLGGPRGPMNGSVSEIPSPVQGIREKPIDKQLQPKSQIGLWRKFCRSLKYFLCLEG